MNVSAIIVTRGNVDLSPVIDSLPGEWEKIVYDNGAGDVIFNGRSVTTHDDSGDPEIAGQRFTRLPDLSVYGRYASIEYASHDLIYVQDDDCIVSEPTALTDMWMEVLAYDGVEGRVVDPRGFVVCNMPEEFRHDFYIDHALVGFGAAFHRAAPERAFQRFVTSQGYQSNVLEHERPRIPGLFDRTCDIVFTALTPHVLVDVPKENLPWAYGDDRMWRQPEHQAERARMLDLVMKIKEAG